MKRLRELTFITLAMIVAVSFLSQYAATASAPIVKIEVPSTAASPASERQRRAYVDQRFIESATPIKKAAAAVFSSDQPANDDVDRDVPAVETASSETPAVETAIVSEAPSAPSKLSFPPLAPGNYCDPTFVGDPITFMQTSEMTLEMLIDQIHTRFGVNFLMGPNLRDLPINIKTGSIPWNILLKSQLFVSGVRARCIAPNTIELVQNSDLPKLQDSADVTTKFVKLKFLQRTSGGTVDLAGRSSQGGGGGSCGAGGSGSGTVTGSSPGGGGGGQSGETAAQLESSRFDKLIVEIEKVLGIRSMTESSAFGQGNQGGGNGGMTEERRTNRFVTQIPGRNILVIRATEEEHGLINEIISRADRPPFQVVIKGLVYTANQTRLFDLGVQTTINNTSTSSNTSGGLFGHTLGNIGTLFDFSTLIGTVNFQVQANAFEQNGVISIKSRPFSTVLDGLCTTLDVGPSLPIVINSTFGGQGSITFVNAANNLSVTPYVVDDDAGNPIAVTLDLKITANDVDNTTVTNGVPAISQRSIQTQLLLGPDKTAILGGFTIDSDRKDISKTPGLGDIPIIGQLFKRRTRNTQVNRLYFALSVAVIPYGDAIEPVRVPGANTDPPSVTPKMFDRSNSAEPAQVIAPKPTASPSPDH